MGSRSKSAVHITPANRVKEFGTDFVVDGVLLICKVCNTPIDHVRKQTISDHLQSREQHTDHSLKRKAETDEGIASKRQTTVTGSK